MQIPGLDSTTGRLTLKRLGTSSLLFIAVVQGASAGDTVSFNLGTLPSADINFSQVLTQSFNSSGTIGKIFGSKNQEIVPEICVPFFGCSDPVTADTRTGIEFDIGAAFNNAIRFDGVIDLSSFDPSKSRADVQSSLSTGGAGSDSFRSLRSGLNVSVNESDFSLAPPSFRGGLNISGGINANFDLLSFLGGRKLIDAGTSLGGNWDLDLISIDTANVTNPFGLPTSLLNQIPNLGLDTEVGLGGDTLFRQTFGPTDPVTKNKIRAVNVDLLSPTVHYQDDTRVRGDTVVNNTSLDAIRFGIDLLKLNPALANALAGKKPLGGKTLKYDLLSLTLGANLGYSKETRVTPVADQGLLSFDGQVAVRLPGSVVQIWNPGDAPIAVNPDALPDVRIIGSNPVTATLAITDLSVNSSETHSIRISPTGNLTILPKASLGSSLKIPSLAHFNLSKTFEVPVSSSATSTFIANVLAGGPALTTGITIDSGRRYDSFEPYIVTPLGSSGSTFVAIANVLPETTVVNPLTGISRQMFNLDPAIESILEQQQIPGSSASFATFFATADARINPVNAVTSPGFTPRVAPATTRNINQVSDFALVNRDGVNTSRRLNSIDNDGVILVTGEDLRLHSTALRQFTGNGTLIINNETRIAASTTGAPLFVNGAGHTTVVTGQNNNFTGRDNLLWFKSPLAGQSNSVQMRNDGTLLATNSGDAIIDFWGLDGIGVFNSGLIEARTPDSIFRINTAKGITNNGVIAATAGGKFIIDNPVDNPSDPTDNQIFLYNNDALGAAIYRENGSQSDLSFVDRVRLLTGTHRFEAANDGSLVLNEGLGRIFNSGTTDAGRLEIDVGQRGQLRAGELVRANGSINIAASGYAQSMGSLPRTQAGFQS